MATVEPSEDYLTPKEDVPPEPPKPFNSGIGGKPGKIGLTPEEYAASMKASIAKHVASMSPDEQKLQQALMAQQQKAAILAQAVNPFSSEIQKLLQQNPPVYQGDKVTTAPQFMLWGDKIFPGCFMKITEKWENEGSDYYTHHKIYLEFEWSFKYQGTDCPFKIGLQNTDWTELQEILKGCVLAKKDALVKEIQKAAAEEEGNLPPPGMPIMESLGE